MKAGIIGAGFVGSTTAYTLAIQGTAQEIVLIDINGIKAEAEALDIEHATVLNRECEIKNGNYEDLAGADVVIITVDSQQILASSRLELLDSNTKIIKAIIPNIVKYAPDSILLIATNPVDVITKAAMELSGFPSGRVIGSGTVLDTARFRNLLSRRLGVSPKSLHAYVLGEHGGSSLVSWSTASIGGSSIEDFAAKTGKPFTQAEKEQISQDVIDAGFRIYQGKKATYYGIAASLCEICKAIAGDEKRDLTVSSYHEQIEGVKSICLSLPSVVGRNGIIQTAEPELSPDEKSKLKESAEVLFKANQAAEDLIK